RGEIAAHVFEAEDREALGTPGHGLPRARRQQDRCQNQTAPRTTIHAAPASAVAGTRAARGWTRTPDLRRASCAPCTLPRWPCAGTAALDRCARPARR